MDPTIPSQLVNGSMRLSASAERLIADTLAGVPSTRRPIATRLLRATAVGDALGVTTEFMSRDEAARTVERHREAGYPFVPVGGGPFAWDAGDISDDTEMAMVVIRGCSRQTQQTKRGTDLFAEEYLTWMATNPRDVGMTIRRVLTVVRSGKPAFEAAWEDHQQHPHSAANGSLMRNGVVAAFADSIEYAYRLSLVQGIATHQHPQCVICCALHAGWIFESLQGQDSVTAQSGWLRDALTRFEAWLFTTCENEEAIQWRDRVGVPAFRAAVSQITTALSDIDAFDPHQIDLLPAQGWVVQSLKIALWAMQVAQGRHDGSNAFSSATTASPSLYRNIAALSAIACLGADADTYGAIAAPMIAALTLSSPSIAVGSYQRHCPPQLSM